MLDVWKFLREFISFPRQRGIPSQKEIPGGHEIILGKGIGDIHFGASSKEIEAILGLPDFTGRLHSSVLAYTYHSISTVLCFYEYQSFEGTDTLMEIRTENQNCTLFGKPVLGARENDLLLEVKQHDLEFTLERNDEILRFNVIELDCHLRDGCIEKVEFRMFF